MYASVTQLQESQIPGQAPHAPHVPGSFQPLAAGWREAASPLAPSNPVLSIFIHGRGTGHFGNLPVSIGGAENGHWVQKGLARRDWRGLGRLHKPP